jgi:hypothetical protein
VKPDAALVGSDRVRHLHPPPPVHPDLAGIVLPDDAKGDHTVRLGQPFQHLGAGIAGISLFYGDDVRRHLADRLQENVLAGVAGLGMRHEIVHK